MVRYLRGDYFSIYLQVIYAEFYYRCGCNGPAAHQHPLHILSPACPALLPVPPPQQRYCTAVAMPQATLGDMSGLERYLAADGGSKKFDMVDGGEYDGDKACEFRVFLPWVFRCCGKTCRSHRLHLLVLSGSGSTARLYPRHPLPLASVLLHAAIALRLGFKRLECLHLEHHYRALKTELRSLILPRHVQSGGG